MAIPQWDKTKYSIHNDIIDAEHKRLFDIAQRAQDMINKQTDAQEIKQILTELFEYMKVHFKDEETYMASMNYPRLHIQKELHRQIIDNMKELIVNIKYDFKQKLAMIVEKWLIEHIIKEDMLIEEYRKTHLQAIQHYQDEHTEFKKTPKYIYKCGCPNRTFEVAQSIHQKIQNGQIFHCKKCGKVIEFLKIDFDTIKQTG